MFELVAAVDAVSQLRGELEGRTSALAVGNEAPCAVLTTGTERNPSASHSFLRCGPRQLSLSWLSG